MAIRLYNTMTRQKEEFVPRDPGKVSMYVCGPTTYNLIHLGNARPLIVFDTIRRYFQYKGFQVNYVQNFTDIDDKIIKRSQEEKMDALALAQKYIGEYFKDAGALGVMEADIHPKVSEHIPDVLEMIETLVKKGFAYEIEGDVYFSVEKFADYGKLSGRALEDMQAGARVGVDERKRNPMDFALWKSAKPGEPAWDSPWGPGRPGWHIECSAMSLKYLGPSFDIHGGGFDLIFPHHENEIAQSEAYADGQTFSKYWMHNGFITINEEKMSKSLGNFFTVREILAKYPPEVVRYYMLATHYRSPLDFDDSKLEMNKRSLERLTNTLANLENLLKGQPVEADTQGIDELKQAVEQCRTNFETAMDDDFNTALAIAALFDLSREINGFVGKNTGTINEAGYRALAGAKEAMEALGNVLGIFVGQGAGGTSEELVDGLMQLIIEIRAEARAKKDWPTADKIRDTLNQLEILIEDTAQGTRWKRK